MEIVLDEVCFGYSRKRQVLDGVTAKIGLFPLAVLGPNGAGKSTLLSLLAGRHEASTGTMTIRTADGREAGDSKERRRLASLMPQDVPSLLGFRVREQIAYSGWLRGMRYSDAYERAEQAERAVDLSAKSRASVATLSGGQRRRLGLASAIVSSPSLLLLDEPHAGLDPEQRGTVRTALRAMSGTSLVVSTHQTEDLDDFYETVLVIDEGRIRFVGTTQEFLASVPADIALHERAEYAYRRVIKPAPERQQ